MNIQVRSLKPASVFTFLSAILSFWAAKAQGIPDFTVQRALHTLNSRQYGEQSKRIKKVKQYNFIIVFKNDSTIEVKTGVEQIADIFVMIIGKKDDMMVIKPEQTKLVLRRLSGGKRISGIPYDKGWIFKTNNGPIYTFSFSPEEIESEDEIIAIQKGEGPIVLFSAPNLVAMIESTSEAYAYAQKGDRKAIFIYNDENKRR